MNSEDQPSSEAVAIQTSRSRLVTEYHDKNGYSGVRDRKIQTYRFTFVLAQKIRVVVSRVRLSLVQGFTGTGGGRTAEAPCGKASERDVLAHATRLVGR